MFSVDELKLIHRAIVKLDCSACIYDCDEEDLNYNLCDIIRLKIEKHLTI